MKTQFLKILTCPKCRGELVLVPAAENVEEIKEGYLLCANHHRYKIKNFVPLFSKEENYNKVFSFIHANPVCTSLPPLLDRGRKLSVEEMTKKEFFEQTGFEPRELQGKLILDAGCSSGRFISYLRQEGVGIIGVDLQSDLLQKHANRFKSGPPSGLIQANLFELPFQENSFDYIFSLGVLHHTPNPKEAFKNLVRYLKKDGKIAIWVYSTEPKTHVSDMLRNITTRLPLSLLFILGFMVTIPYGPLLRIPRIGPRLRSLFYRLRLPWHENWRWRIHSFMDWYGPKYQFKFASEEIQQWFREAGLTNIKSFSYEIAVQGTKI